ncbi:MAG: S1 RNA-binding domain-containing protein [Candidatus Niyogibacteria bacterium]|nr:S1 RNA-binding domain-containing protein [Candidatus Niyogibacteria bacterium]
MLDLNNTVSNNAALASDIKKKKATSMDFLFKSINVSAPKAGDLLDGKVLSKLGQKVFVDLGSFGTGVIYGREFINARDLIKKLHSGDAVSAKVIDLENEDGYVELSEIRKRY